MNEIDFDPAFRALTGNAPFPWQRDLYENWFTRGKFPDACTLPTGLGKTSVIAVWLIALANGKPVPRRLVYVVNRRTVVDQATREAEKLRANLAKVTAVETALWKLCAVQSTEDEKANGELRPLAISTLRGQKAESNDWWENPARPAVVVGTVDLIGSRLLFQGYRAGYRRRPLFAGFLGQDALIVHDEAHLEKPFQDLLVHVRNEQADCGLKPFRVVALTATPRGGEDVFKLTDKEEEPPATLPDPPTEPIHHVWKRLEATKTLSLHKASDDKAAVVAKVAELAAKFKDAESKPAVLVFVRKVKDVNEVRDALIRKYKVERESICVLTGTMRGWERDRMADPRRADADPVFARFLKRPEPSDPPEDQWKIEPCEGTVYLICTAAGEVGVDMSADHLVCDLSTFESMAQRFGRVNRYGERSDTTVAVVCPDKFDDKHPLTPPRRLTHELLAELEPDVSPLALGKLDAGRRLAAFAPTPPAPTPTGIVYDAWALTSVCKQLTDVEDLPGRPAVADYLHGITDDDPDTQVAWRSEVCWLGQAGLPAKALTKLLDEYPLKPHELLRSPSYQVRDWLVSLATDDRRRALPVWVVSVRGDVTAHTLGELTRTRPDDKKAYLVAIEGRTLVLPPEAGGLKADGMIGPTEDGVVLDVADALTDAQGRPIRHHALTDGLAVPTGAAGMRVVQSIPLRMEDAPEADTQTACDDTVGKTHARFFTRPWEADDDGSERAAGMKPVAWQVHTDDVVEWAGRFADALLTSREREALITAAHLHDLGKRRAMWQAGIGNRGYPAVAWAKSGSRRGGFRHDYRHEFGSLLDAKDEAAFRELPDDETKDLVMHLIATHHGRGRPHFPAVEVFDPGPRGRDAAMMAAEVPRRFARLQRKYGRWGLAYLESLLRAADAVASARPSKFMEGEE